MYTYIITAEAKDTRMPARKPDGPLARPRARPARLIIIRRRTIIIMMIVIVKIIIMITVMGNNNDNYNNSLRRAKGVPRKGFEHRSGRGSEHVKG